VALPTVWLTRGIETSAAMRTDLTFDDEKKMVTWFLPASKTDVRALGSAFAHSCWCGNDTEMSSLCPYHIAKELVRAVDEKFRGREPKTVPLFPTREGKTMSKAQNVQNLRAVLKAADIETTKQMGSATRQRFSEHSCRVSGTQFFARLGWHLDIIKALGRWNSIAIERYAQTAPVEATLASGARRATNTDAIEKTLLEMKEKAQEQAQLIAQLNAKLESLASNAAADKEGDLDVVKNLATGMRHIIKIGHKHQEVETALYRTMCGWRFANAAYSSSNDKTGGVDACAKCFGTKQQEKDSSDEEDSDEESSDD